MAHASTLIAKDILAYLDAHQRKSLLRFLICGSIGDGTSTLAGRLLYDSKVISEDQLAVREQGATTDVAYHYFFTDKRQFIVADAPGDEQYTRNMISGASTAELTVILIDARKGVLTQTRRHSLLAALFGIRKVVLAVNKMDLVGYSRSVFEQIVADYRAFAARIGLDDILAIPVSGLCDDNITTASTAMPWYQGPTMMHHLETVDVEDRTAAAPFRMSVQWVNRPGLDFRGFSGLIASGTVKPGDKIKVLPSGKDSKVTRIVTYDGDLPQAVAGQAVTLTLENEIDINRGDLIAHAASPPGVADQFNATLVWMSDEPLLAGRLYWLKVGATLVTATVTEIKYKFNINTLEQLAARTLELNEIGVVNLSLDRPVPFDPYTANRETGGFILIDRFNNGTVGAGIFHFALRRSENIHWQAVDVDKEARATLKRQKACVLWFTGLSAAGKSTIANLVEKQLFAQGRHTYLLDGDNVRHGLARDLGFTDTDRVENIRRVAEVSKLMVDAGLIVLVSFISPFRAERRLARQLLEAGEFLEVFVDTPIAVAETRDPKGLYKKARAGEIKNFTGITSPYERPENPEIVIDTTRMTPEEAAGFILGRLEDLGLVLGVHAAADTTPSA